MITEQIIRNAVEKLSKVYIKKPQWITITNYKMYAKVRHDPNSRYQWTIDDLIRRDGYEPGGKTLKIYGYPVRIV